MSEQNPDLWITRLVVSEEQAEGGMRLRAFLADRGAWCPLEASLAAGARVELGTTIALAVDGGDVHALGVLRAGWSKLPVAGDLERVHARGSVAVALVRRGAELTACAYGGAAYAGEAWVCRSLASDAPATVITGNSVALVVQSTAEGTRLYGFSALNGEWGEAFSTETGGVFVAAGNAALAVLGPELRAFGAGTAAWSLAERSPDPDDRWWIDTDLALVFQPAHGLAHACSALAGTWSTLRTVSPGLPSTAARIGGNTALVADEAAGTLHSYSALMNSWTSIGMNAADTVAVGANAVR